jgi:hypothetical protein
LGNNDNTTLPLELALVDCYLSQETKPAAAEKAEPAVSRSAKAETPKAESVKAEPTKSNPAAAHPPVDKSSTVQPPHPEKTVKSEPAPKPETSPASEKKTAPVMASTTAPPLVKETVVNPPVIKETAPVQRNGSTKEVGTVKETGLVQETGPVAVPSLSSEIERLRLHWKQVTDGVDPSLKRTAALALLKSNCKPISIQGDIVTLAFGYPILKNNAEKSENKPIVEKIISDYLGRPCKIECILETKKEGLVEKAKKMGAQVISTEEK